MIRRQLSFRTHGKRPEAVASVPPFVCTIGTPNALEFVSEQHVGPLPRPAPHTPYPIQLAHPRKPAAFSSCWLHLFISQVRAEGLSCLRSKYNVACVASPGETHAISASASGA